MPLKQCQKDGKPGWKWGDAGTCYTGEDAKQKAIKQGIAIGDIKSARFNGHNLYTLADFNSEEKEQRNLLYVKVVEEGGLICKNCGGSDIDETCKNQHG